MMFFFSQEFKQLADKKLLLFFFLRKTILNLESVQISYDDKLP